MSFFILNNFSPTSSFSNNQFLSELHKVNSQLYNCILDNYEFCTSNTTNMV